MKNRTKPLRGKLLAVLMAGILGAALFDGSMFALNEAYKMSSPGRLRDSFTLIGYILAVPMLLIVKALGLKETLVTGYLINGMFGAATFALVSAIRQFLFKNGNEK